MSNDQEFLLKLLPNILSPQVLATFLLLCFYRKVASILDRFTEANAQFGSNKFSIIASGPTSSTLNASITTEDHSERRQYVEELLRKFEPKTPVLDSPVTEQDISELTQEHIMRIEALVLSAAISTLEVTLGYPNEAFERYKRITSPLLSRFLTIPSLYFHGVINSQNELVLAFIIIDSEYTVGDQELFSDVAGMLFALEQVIGKRQKWRFVLGVLPSRVDSLQRVRAVQAAFAPATLAGNLQVVPLDPNMLTNQELQHGLISSIQEIRATRVNNP